MEVIYSIGCRFAGGGIGNIAYYAVKGIYSHKYLKKLFCLDYKETEIDKQKIEKINLAHFSSLSLRAFNKFIFRKFASKDLNHQFYTNLLYDLFVSRKLTKCEVFHGWNDHSLKSLRRAKELGAVTIIERASSHPLTNEKLLEEEYRTLNIKKDKDPQLKLSSKELEECDFITIPSDFVRESFLEQGVDENKLIQIPFGFDGTIYSPKEKEEDVFRITFAGNVIPRKGCHYLLEAWRELNLKNSELCIAGYIFEEMKDIVRKYDERNIKFLGHISETVKLYQNSSVFVLPSIEEGSALVSYEAMACGLPVIVTTNTGSVARDGKDGFVIPIRDIEAIKEKIQYFYDNPGEIRRMGQNARKHIENYTWEKYGDNLVKAYESRCR